MASPHPQWASKYTQISDSSTQKVVFSSDTMKKKRERKEKEKEKKKEEGEKKTQKSNYHISPGRYFLFPDYENNTWNTMNV